MLLIRSGFAALILITATGGQAGANSSTDACGAVICLAGEMNGHGGGAACSGYIAKYFSIIDWHHGHMDLGPTSRDRMIFLNQCTMEDPAIKQAVNDKYGTQADAP
ncbi:hypothetical protein AWB68_07493 [Caballeronia choica]|uniref:TrbM protein n=1 Tax=Caballeronia choica TaxID=326476 RepID=A0A158KUT3_9BURK|nr:killer protein [Caballeronia choica]SAL84912.1 hypothetical protein AWB68_07493 [Caballeronia choica]